MHIKLKRSPGLYLAGFMGSGKSTVGAALAEHLGWDFVDLDSEIEEQEGEKISSIFDSTCESMFSNHSGNPSLSNRSKRNHSL